MVKKNSKYSALINFAVRASICLMAGTWVAHAVLIEPKGSDVWESGTYRCQLSIPGDNHQFLKPYFEDVSRVEGQPRQLQFTLNVGRDEVERFFDEHMNEGKFQLRIEMLGTKNKFWTDLVSFSVFDTLINEETVGSISFKSNTW